MTRRRFLSMLAITCLAPVRVATGLMKAVPIRKIPTGEFLMRSTYLPLYTTPCCLTAEELTAKIAKQIATVQLMLPYREERISEWLDHRSLR